MRNRLRTALIVDDDPIGREVLSEFLAVLGYRVREAPEAWSALKVLAQERPDIVCVDLMLPGLSGFELCELVRRDPRLRGLKLLVISARSLPQDHAQAIAAGADAFVDKPINLKRLQEALVELTSPAVQGAAS